LFCVSRWDCTHAKENAIVVSPRLPADRRQRANSNKEQMMQIAPVETEPRDESVKTNDTPTSAQIEDRSGIAGIRVGEFAGVPDSLGRLGDCHEYLARYGDEVRARSNFRFTYSYAIPNRAAISVIACNSPHGLIELGAGTGYWAYLLRHFGATVDAYDRTPDIRDNCYFVGEPAFREQSWTRVDTRHARAIDAGRSEEDALSVLA
jgi:hypothetical protein